MSDAPCDRQELRVDVKVGIVNDEGAQVVPDGFVENDFVENGSVEDGSVEGGSVVDVQQIGDESACAGWA